jgi:mRNA-degrading endonuclease RelE of RelBE toxin-antitoxin system
LYKLAIHQSAKDDLVALAKAPPTAVVAAKVLELARELRANPSLLANLLDHGYTTEDIDVSKFQEFWRQRLDLWRLKLWELEDAGLKYRIIYAYKIDSLCFHILAVVHRDFDYDPAHLVTRRILHDYAEL